MLSVPDNATPGTVLHRTTAAGLQLLGDALELRHRLPSVWAATRTGTVPAYRARQVAQATRMLSREAAAFVDRQVMVAGTIGYARLAKLIAAAVAMHMPDLAEEQRIAAADQRRFDIDPLPGTNGLAAVSGLLDVADALDLEAAISDSAARLGRDGCHQSLDVRRSLAAGELSRGRGTLDHTDDPETSQPRRRARGRQVVLYAHIAEQALGGEAGLARLQNLDQPILTGQVRDWCGRPDTTVIVQPVIDQRDTVAVDQYEIPDRIAERVRLRDHRCVFPWCNNQTGDADHTIAYADGGPTSTDNLALVCRRHHRAKTHTRWRYRTLRPGLHLWTSPHGHHWLKDTYGTHRLD